MSQRFEGRNLDEALSRAGAALGVERYRLKYAVAVEKRGFLGGMKRIVIDAAIDESVPVIAAPPAEAEPEPQPSFAPAAPRKREREPGSRPPRRRDRGDRSRPSGRGEGRRAPERSREFNAVPPPAQEVESSEASAVRAWLEEFSRRGNFQLELRTIEFDDHLDVRLYGRDAGKFVADAGELLDSVQVVINKALVGRRTLKPIELDAGGFKEQRTRDLSEKALEIAGQVRSDGRERLLPSMTPIERRIVHVTLKEAADVTTESRGDGFYKRVAVRRAEASDNAGDEG